MIMAAALSFSVKAEWSYVANTDSFTAYLDFSTLRKTPNGFRVWDLHNYNTRPSGGALSVSGLIECDCKEERIKTLQESHYSGIMGHGEVLKSSNTAGQWEYAMPESIAEALLKAVCGRKR